MVGWLKNMTSLDDLHKCLKYSEPKIFLGLLNNQLPSTTLIKLKYDTQLLLLAVDRIYPKVVKRLFELGANPNCKYRNEPMFKKVILLGNKEILLLFIRFGYRLEDFHDSQGRLRSVIGHVSMYGKRKFEILRILLKFRPTELNTLIYGSTSLLDLMRVDYLSSMLLLKRGASCMIRNKYGLTDLMIFVKSKRLKKKDIPILKYLIETTVHCEKTQEYSSSSYSILLSEHGFMKKLDEVPKVTRVVSYLISLTKRNKKVD